MARGEARCLVCETPLAARGTLTAGCCGVRFHEKCVADHCGQQGARAPGEVRIAPRRRQSRSRSHTPFGTLNPPLLSDFRDISLPSSPPALPSPRSRVPRAASSCASSFPRIPRSPPPSPATHPATRRQEYHLFVPDHPPTPLATRDLCARLFDIDPARVKLLAKGRALVDESAVADASASGAPILLVGVRRDRLVRAVSPRDARSAARNVPSKSRGASPSNLSSRLASRAHRARGGAGRITRAVVRRYVRAVPRPRVEEPVRARVSGTRREETERTSVGRRREGRGPPAAEARGSGKGTTPVPMNRVVRGPVRWVRVHRRVRVG